MRLTPYSHGAGCGGTIIAAGKIVCESENSLGSGSLSIAQLGEQSQKFLTAARQRPELGTDGSYDVKQLDNGVVQISRELNGSKTLFVLNLSDSAQDISAINRDALTSSWAFDACSSKRVSCTRATDVSCPCCRRGFWKPKRARRCSLRRLIWALATSAYT